MEYEGIYTRLNELYKAQRPLTEWIGTGLPILIDVDVNEESVARLEDLIETIYETIYKVS